MLAEPFNVPPTQVDVMASDRYLIYNSLEAATAVGEGQTVTLDIPGCSPGSVYDLANSYIQVRGKFVSTAVVDNATQVSTVHGWTSRVFNRMSMTFGSTNVVEDFSDYGIAHYLHQLWTRSHSDLQADEFVGGWTEDVKNAAQFSGLIQNPVGGAVYNPGAIERRQHYLHGGALGADMQRPNVSFKHVPLGPWATAKLPSDVGIRLRFTRGKDNELIIGEGKTAAAFTFQLENVQAYMHRVQMTPDADAALLKHMHTKDWLIPHERVRQMTQSYAAGTNFMEVRAALQGPKPNRVYMWTAFEASTSGTYETATPFRLDHANRGDAAVQLGEAATEVRLRVGDTDVPLRGYECIPGNRSGVQTEDTRIGNKDIAEAYEALKALSFPGDPGITSRQYFNIRIFAFDCSLATQTALDPIQESTQIQASMRINGAGTRLRRVLGLISYTPSVITIDHQRTVTVDQ